MKALIASKNRGSPKFYYSDYLVLRSIKNGIANWLRSVVLPKNAFVLEVGCGAAPLRQEFLRAGFKYVGIDRFPTKGADIVGDGNALPFKKNSFDIVFHSCVLEHVINPPQFISETARVLKPGGYIVFITHGCFPYHGTSEEYDDFWRWTHKGLARLVKDVLGAKIHSINVSALENDWVAILSHTAIAFRRTVRGHISAVLIGPLVVLSNILGVLFETIRCRSASVMPLCYLVCVQTAPDSHD